MQRIAKQLLVLSVMVAATFTLVFAKDNPRHNHWGHGVSISQNDSSDSDDCAEHLQIWSDDQPSVARAEETKNLPNAPLKITAAHNGGIQVRNWDKPEIGIKVCKAAAAKNDAEANKVLADIQLVQSGGELSVRGPNKSGDWDDNDSPGTTWVALVMVFAPKGATLDLNAYNGGIS